MNSDHRNHRLFYSIDSDRRDLDLDLDLDRRVL